MKKKNISSLFDEAKQKDTFWTTKAILEFTSELYQLMKRRGLTKADMARELGTSQAYISKVFKGDANFTIDSMVRLARIFGANIHIHIAATDAYVRWFDVITGGKQEPISWNSADFQKIDDGVLKNANSDAA